MAEIITIPDLENGKVDIDTLADIVNLQEPTTETRLSGPVNTWFGIQASLSAASGLAYETKALMDAAPGTVAGQAARVTDDGDNTGYYVWSGSAWVRTQDPLDGIAEKYSQALVLLMTKMSYSRIPLSVWGETPLDVYIDKNGNISGGGDVINDHEIRIQNVESGGASGGNNILPIHMGQGQSNVTGAGDPVPFPGTSTPIYPDRALMPGGIDMNVATGTYSSGTYGPIDPLNYQSFQPLRSMNLSAASSTTLFEGIGFAQAREEESQGKKNARLYWTTGQGGVSLAARSPGTMPYDNTLIAINRSVEIASSIDKIAIVESIHSVEGEADVSTVNFDQALAAVYLDQLTADIKQATGQLFDPALILTQPSSFASSLEAVNGIYRLAKNNPRAFLATAGYHIPYWTDLLHYSSVGHPINGEYHLRVLRALRNGRIWNPVMPKFIKWDGGTGVDVWFHVPEPPLVLDITAPNHGNFGFVIRSDSANMTISSIEQMGPDHIHFETATPIGANRSLQYAMRGYQSFPRTEGDGPMGSLRDSCNEPSMFDPNHILWNWGVHFTETF